MSKFGACVRFRDTSFQGRIYRRIIHNGEALWIILWDHGIEPDPRPYASVDLESTPRTERINQQIIYRQDCMDRKEWEERVALRGTVKGREDFRGGDGWTRI